MNERITGGSPKASRLSDARGFSVVEMLIVVAIIAIITAFAILGHDSARASLRTADSARELASYLEKARLDSIRRRATVAPTTPPSSSQQATVSIVSNNAYTVTMDFDGNGSVAAGETRTISLQTGVTFSSPAAFPTTITFDWRGRPTSGSTTIFTLPGQPSANLVVTALGDISNLTNTDTIGPASSTNLNVNATVDPTADVKDVRQN